MSFAHSLIRFVRFCPLPLAPSPIAMGEGETVCATKLNHQQNDRQKARRMYRRLCPLLPFAKLPFRHPCPTVLRPSSETRLRSNAHNMPLDKPLVASAARNDILAVISNVKVPKIETMSRRTIANSFFRPLCALRDLSGEFLPIPPFPDAPAPSPTPRAPCRP